MKVSPPAAVWGLREYTPRQIREGLSSRCAKSLTAYRRHCASPSSAGQLVLPESMKLLPLYTSCMLRSDAIAGGNWTTFALSFSLKRFENICTYTQNKILQWIKWHLSPALVTVKVPSCEDKLLSFLKMASMPKSIQSKEHIEKFAGSEDLVSSSVGRAVAVRSCELYKKKLKPGWLQNITIFNK